MKFGKQVGVAKVLIVILLVIVATAGLGIYKAGAPKRAQEAKLKAEQAEEQRLSSIDEATCSRVAFDAADAKLKELMVRFQDASELAKSSSRIALAGPVASLQQIKRDLPAVVVPKCMENVKKNIVAAMEHHIQLFLSFMQSDERSSAHYATLYAEHMAMAASEVNYIRKCAPRCREKWTGVDDTKAVQ